MTWGLMLGALAMVLVSCKKDDDTKSNVMTRTGIVVAGAQEVPAVTTAAAGTLDVSYDKSNKMLTYTVRWNGLTANLSGMHFHGPAMRGANAGVLVNITGFTAGTSGTHSGMVMLDEATLKEADLLGGMWYINLHNASFPGGEIRGQIEF